MLPIAKLMFGVGKPWKERILGTELAGEVERAGNDSWQIVSKLEFSSIVGMYENSLTQMPSVASERAMSATNSSGLLEVVEHRDARHDSCLAVREPLRESADVRRNR